jgi:hypothetical protein
MRDEADQINAMGGDGNEADNVEGFDNLQISLAMGSNLQSMIEMRSLSGRKSLSKDDTLDTT